MNKVEENLGRKIHRMQGRHEVRGKTSQKVAGIAGLQVDGDGRLSGSLVGAGSHERRGQALVRMQSEGQEGGFQTVHHRRRDATDAQQVPSWSLNSRVQSEQSSEDDLGVVPDCGRDGLTMDSAAAGRGRALPWGPWKPQLTHGGRALLVAAQEACSEGSRPTGQEGCIPAADRSVQPQQDAHAPPPGLASQLLPPGLAGQQQAMSIVRATMVAQQSTFTHQVQELHRLVEQHRAVCEVGPSDQPGRGSEPRGEAESRAPMLAPQAKGPARSEETGGTPATGPVKRSGWARKAPPQLKKLDLEAAPAEGPARVSLATHSSAEVGRAAAAEEGAEAEAQAGKRLKGAAGSAVPTWPAGGEWWRGGGGHGGAPPTAEMGPSHAGAYSTTTSWHHPRFAEAAGPVVAEAMSWAPIQRPAQGTYHDARGSSELRPPGQDHTLAANPFLEGLSANYAAHGGYPVSYWGAGDWAGLVAQQSAAPYPSGLGADLMRLRQGQRQMWYAPSAPFHALQQYQSQTPLPPPPAPAPPLPLPAAPFSAAPIPVAQMWGSAYPGSYAAGAAQEGNAVWGGQFPPTTIVPPPRPAFKRPPPLVLLRDSATREMRLVPAEGRVDPGERSASSSSTEEQRADGQEVRRGHSAAKGGRARGRGASGGARRAGGARQRSIALERPELPEAGRRAGGDGQGGSPSAEEGTSGEEAGEGDVIDPGERSREMLRERVQAEGAVTPGRAVQEDAAQEARRGGQLIPLTPPGDSGARQAGRSSRALCPSAWGAGESRQLDARNWTLAMGASKSERAASAPRPTEELLPSGAGSSRLGETNSLGAGAGAGAGWGPKTAAAASRKPGSIAPLRPRARRPEPGQLQQLQLQGERGPGRLLRPCTRGQGREEGREQCSATDSAASQGGGEDGHPANGRMETDELCENAGALRPPPGNSVKARETGHGAGLEDMEGGDTGSAAAHVLLSFFPDSGAAAALCRSPPGCASQAETGMESPFALSLGYSATPARLAGGASVHVRRRTGGEKLVGQPAEALEGPPGNSQGREQSDKRASWTRSGTAGMEVALGKDNADKQKSTTALDLFESETLVLSPTSAEEGMP